MVETGFKVEAAAPLPIGGQVEAGRWRATLDKVEIIEGPNYLAERGTLTIGTVDGRAFPRTVTAENDGWFVIIETPSGVMAFQKVDAVTPGENRLHIDFTVEGSLSEAADLLIAQGASLLAERSEGENRWFTLADPQGNEFCVARED